LNAGSDHAGSDHAEDARPELGAPRDLPLWLDNPERPPRRPALEGDRVIDLLVVGAGLSGLWAALQAAEQSPARSIAVLDGGAS
jgi:hypothetical protein